MSDEGRVHPAIAIELLLEGKNHQSLVDVVTDQPHATLPPRPELRGDIVDRRDAAPLHLPRDAPVERRGIDDDSQIRLALVGFRDQSSIEPENLWQMTEDLRDADDSQVFRVDNGVAACGAHAVSTDAEKLELAFKFGCPRMTYGAAQRLNKLRPIHFPRSFAS